MTLIDMERIKRVVFFKEGAFREIRDDKNAMSQAIAVLYIAAIIGSIWMILQTFGFALIGILIGVPIGWVIFTGILHIISMLFGGKSSFEGYLKTTAFAQIPTALGVIPILGSFVGGIWCLALVVMATKEAQELTLGKAVLVVLIPLLLLAILVLLVGLALIPVMMSGGFDPGVMSYY